MKMIAEPIYSTEYFMNMHFVPLNSSRGNGDVVDFDELRLADC
jgi:hypothetical protein